MKKTNYLNVVTWVMIALNALALVNIVLFSGLVLLLTGGSGDSNIVGMSASVANSMRFEMFGGIVFSVLLIVFGLKLVRKQTLANYSKLVKLLMIELVVTEVAMIVLGGREFVSSGGYLGVALGPVVYLVLLSLSRKKVALK